MRFAIRLAFGLTIFLTTAGLVYAFTSHERLGSVLLLVLAIAFLYVGLALRHSLRRAGAEEGHEEEAEEPEEVEPTIWPFIASIAALALVIGAVGSRWVLILAVILFVVVGAGWFTDIQRQRVHAAAANGSRALESEEPQTQDPEP